MDKIAIESDQDDEELLSLSFEAKGRSIEELQDMLRSFADALPRLAHVDPDEVVNTSLH